MFSRTRKDRKMKIVVIGGTGLIGSKLFQKLTEHGHEAIAASPDTGVNTITGEGLADVLNGAESSPTSRTRGPSTRSRRPTSS
jgi:dTDP-4-dehydrorhamnose reductase